MSELKDRLQDDLTQAMRDHDEVTLRTVRMLLTAITNAEVAGSTAKELSDDEIIAVASTEAKKRREAAMSYTDGGAPDRAQAELAELDVILRYLPSQLSEDELQAMVDEAVAAAAAEGKTGPSAMGAVMKTLQPKVRGRADVGAVAAMVKTALAS
jgi:Uncharacterized conserved protein